MAGPIGTRRLISDRGDGYLQLTICAAVLWPS
jgi:hypothetical protein